MFLNLLNRLFRSGSQGRMPKRSRARQLARAIELQKSGAVGPAEAILRQMLSSLPRDEDVLHLLGSLLIQQQRPAEAAAVLREVIALRPDSAEAHFNLGTACSALGQFEGAARYFVRAAALRPGFAAAHLALGNALKAAREPDAAEDAYRNALSQDPDRKSTRLNSSHT